jgi:DNA repair photolyase
MFPSAHDITPFNLDAYVRVARLMLEAGNKLLIVSKPNYDCIARLCDEFRKFKEQILFRFTIGTTENAVAAHWEPGAPAPTERVEALAFAHRMGYRTSVSAEPLLGGLDTAQALLEAVRPYVTDTVWIGKMNKIRARVDMSVPENKERALEIERVQTDAEVLRLFNALDGDPQVRWKDSIHEARARMASTAQKSDNTPG